MITLIAAGTVDRELMKTLSYHLTKIFKTEISIVSPMGLPLTAFNTMRRQYHAGLILQDIKERSDGKGDRRLCIVDADLYVPELNFVFGLANPTSREAVISLTRLRQEFYGLPGNSDLFLDRTVKEAVHELGHTFNLKHCNDKHCVMYFSNSLRDTDQKNSMFCSWCLKKQMHLIS